MAQKTRRRKEGTEELKRIKRKLTEWEWDVAQVITEIPRGKLTTYGCLTKIAGRRHGHDPTASRAVGNLRNKLYRLLTHDTESPCTG